ncbi:hypothetical protein NG895_25370 [Aeoliella sp. ICT_H6.2]|uniref:Uncharacterized protein n=1 Tax=Aeoliella straminimaris TaxID=2954799 RepID=A0A9X2FEK2_9BACT|nr:hypothetical protein [Aeoliella straminimaris]MCO6047244.1 hypothetical protein [Aeoliella straminimaris]
MNPHSQQSEAASSDAKESDFVSFWRYTWFHQLILVPLLTYKVSKIDFAEPMGLTQQIGLWVLVFFLGEVFLFAGWYRIAKVDVE